MNPLYKQNPLPKPFPDALIDVSSTTPMVRGSCRNKRGYRMINLETRAAEPAVWQTSKRIESESRWISRHVRLRTGHQSCSCLSWVIPRFSRGYIKRSNGEERLDASALRPAACMGFNKRGRMWFVLKQWSE